MKKKIFLSIIIFIMIAIIVMAYLKKNNIIDTNRIKNSFKNTTVNKNNKSTMKNVADNNVKELEDIPIYKIGEEAHCGKIGEKNEVLNFDILVEDVEISDKVDNIPDYFTDDDLLFITKDGYPKDGYGNYKFVNLKIKIINITDKDIEIYLNNLNIIKDFNGTYDYIDDEVVCYSDFDRISKPDYFKKVLGAYEDYETVLSIAIKDEYVEDELMLLVSTSGSLYYYDGAVLIDLKEK